LWGGYPPPDASRTVRTYLSRLRTALRRASTGARFDLLLVTCAPGYRLMVDPEMFDAARFELLAAAGRHALAAEHPELALQRFTDALGLWRGDAFVEFDDHPAISAEGTRLNRLRLMVMEDRIQAALATGRDAQVVGELETLVLAHPARERLWGQLMTALYRCGRQAEALTAFRTARGILVGEYGVEPSPGLVEIHRRILRHDVEPTGPRPVVAA
jgi:DNA-binding SARP family transcriptional activator